MGCTSSGHGVWVKGDRARLVGYVIILCHNITVPNS